MRTIKVLGKFSPCASVTCLLLLGLLAGCRFGDTKTTGEVKGPAEASNPQWVGLCVEVHNASQSVIAAQVRISSGDQALDNQIVHDVIGMKVPPSASHDATWVGLWVRPGKSVGPHPENDLLPKIDCTKLNRELCNKDAC